jgi:hypothetical protein
MKLTDANRSPTRRPEASNKTTVSEWTSFPLPRSRTPVLSSVDKTKESLDVR